MGGEERAISQLVQPKEGAARNVEESSSQSQLSEEPVSPRIRTAIESGPRSFIGLGHEQHVGNVDFRVHPGALVNYFHFSHLKFFEGYFPGLPLHLMNKYCHLMHIHQCKYKSNFVN